MYDVLGRLVDVLVDGPRAAGEHVVHWDGRDANNVGLANGMYLYRLQAITPGGQRTATQKVMLVR